MIRKFMHKHHCRIHFSVQYYQGIPPSLIISALNLLNIEGVELTHAIFDEIDKFVPRLCKMSSGFHLPLLHENGWDFTCSDSQDKIDRTIHLINRYKDDLNMKYAVFHPPEVTTQYKEQKQLFRILLKNLKKIDLPLCIENIPSLSIEAFEDQYKEAKLFLQNRLSGICFDAPHFYIQGNDPIEMYHRLKDNIKVVHLSDCTRDRDCHLPFDKIGQLPVEDILETLQKEKFAGYITLEIKPESLQDMGAYIKSYLKTLRTCNRIKYLKTLFLLFYLRPILKKFSG